MLPGAIVGGGDSSSAVASCFTGPWAGMTRGQTLAGYANFWEHLPDALLTCHALNEQCGGVVVANLYGRDSYLIRSSGAPLQAFVSGISLYNKVC